MYVWYLFQCTEIRIWLLALPDKNKKNVLLISEPHGELFCFILPTLGARYEYFNNQNYFVYLYAIFVSNHRQSNSKLHHAAAEMNKVDVLYSIGMKSSNNFEITAINKII